MTETPSPDFAPYGAVSPYGAVTPGPPSGESDQVTPGKIISVDDVTPGESSADQQRPLGANRWISLIQMAQQNKNPAPRRSRRAQRSGPERMARKARREIRQAKNRVKDGLGLDSEQQRRDRNRRRRRMRRALPQNPQGNQPAPVQDSPVFLVCSECRRPLEITSPTNSLGPPVRATAQQIMNRQRANGHPAQDKSNTQSQPEPETEPEPEPELDQSSPVSSQDQDRVSSQDQVSSQYQDKVKSLKSDHPITDSTGSEQIDSQSEADARFKKRREKRIERQKIRREIMENLLMAIRNGQQFRVSALLTDNIRIGQQMRALRVAIKFDQTQIFQQLYEHKPLRERQHHKLVQLATKQEKDQILEYLNSKRNRP